MSDLTSPCREDLGYVFYPSARAECPGHPRLDVCLRDEPTGQHFDPERMVVQIESRGDIKTLGIRHPWIGPRQFRVCAGRVALEDRKNRFVEAFTYGDELHIGSDESRTTCALISPAPILAMLPGRPLVTMLAVESEIVLAERRGAWAHAPLEFNARLARVDPVQLYVACLDALHEKFLNFPGVDDESISRFIQFLEIELQDLREQGGAGLQIRTPEELL